MTQAGGRIGRPKREISRAMAACMRAISRVSPCISLDRSSVRKPSSRARRAAASSAIRLLPTIVFLTRRNAGSEGFGVSGTSPRAPCSSRRRTAAGTRARTLYSSRTCRASANVLASGAAGPDPITPGSPPMTSESSRASTRAGAANRASWPPLMSEMCFRTVLIWWIFAPHASRILVTACFSSRVIGGAGRVRRAEAPPEIRQITKSSRPAAAAIPAIRRAPAMPRASGTG